MHRLFDITEIFDLILQLLTPVDLAKAATVCHVWSLQCLPRLWRRIDARQYSNPKLVAAIPTYLPYIQELVCDRYDTLAKLGGPACQDQLLVLTAPSVTLENIEETLETLERHPRLEALSLRFEYAGDTSRYIQVVNRVVQLTRLRRLSLNNIRLSSHTMEYLLETTPSLESLTLEKCWRTWHINAKDPAYHQQLRVKPLGKPYSHLRSLTFAGAQFGFETIMHVTRYTPQLESLTLSDEEQPFLRILGEDGLLKDFCRLMPEHCPRLKKVTLYQTACVNQGGLVLFLTAFPALVDFCAIRPRKVNHWNASHRPDLFPFFMFEHHLSALATTSTTTTTTTTIPTASTSTDLTNAGADTAAVTTTTTITHSRALLVEQPRLSTNLLETIRIEHASNGLVWAINNDLFTLFPHLRHVIMPDTVFKVKDALKTPWVCQNLETLTLTMAGPHGWLPAEKDPSRSWLLQSRNGTCTTAASSSNNNAKDGTTTLTSQESKFNIQKKDASRVSSFPLAIYHTEHSWDDFVDEKVRAKEREAYKGWVQCLEGLKSLRKSAIKVNYINYEPWRQG